MLISSTQSTENRIRSSKESSNLHFTTISTMKLNLSLTLTLQLQQQDWLNSPISPDLTVGPLSFYLVYDPSGNSFYVRGQC